MKIPKIIVVAVIVLAMVLSATAYAAVMHMYGKNWVTIKSSSTGLNRNVSVICYNTTGHANDIRMLGSDGSTVWYEEGAINYSGSRVFWCGSDVYQVQIRNKGVTGNLSTESCLVD